MAGRIAVTNTSPLIALVGLDELRLLPALFEHIVVPFEVWEELVAKPGAPEPDELRAWPSITFRPAPCPLLQAVGLDPGERAAIALALATPEAWVLLDDLAARRVATELGLQVKGTLGVLLEAKRAGLVPALKPLLARMTEAGCRLGPELLAAVLAAAGE
ncbi:MAG: DUF3368 domain-containing protein [Polyangiaceae bacterium]|nr:DUF3368 domain-containing protein [Polyangiaceae bacterium]